jgi:hypothetical protein
MHVAFACKIGNVSVQRAVMGTQVMQDKSHFASAQILLKSALDLIFDAMTVLKDAGDRCELPALEHIISEMELRIEAIRQRLLENEFGISPHLQAKFDSAPLAPPKEIKLEDIKSLQLTHDAAIELAREIKARMDQERTSDDEGGAGE